MIRVIEHHATRQCDSATMHVLQEAVGMLWVRQHSLPCSLICTLTQKLGWVDSAPPWPAFITSDPLLPEVSLSTAHWASILHSGPSSSRPAYRLGVEGL